MVGQGEHPLASILGVGPPLCRAFPASSGRFGGRRGAGFPTRSGRGWPTFSLRDFLIPIGHSLVMTTTWHSEKDADARRARRERVMAQRAMEPAPPPRPTPPPLGDEEAGSARDLRPGDVVMAWGGHTPARDFKRNTLGEDWTVERTSVKPRARTRMQLAFTNGREFTLRFDYPVRYRRPVTTTS